MPSGLDGNPNPITTPERSGVIDTMVASIGSTKAPDRPLIVAIDGIDGAGKSTFADEVAHAARQRGMSIVRSTIDSFHNERSIRHTRGPTSPLRLPVEKVGDSGVESKGARRDSATHGPLQG